MVKVKSLREEIIAFREQLNSPNKPDFSWAHTALLDFEDKENYPIDFQIFMEEIGELSASSRREGGYQILYLEKPRTVEKPDFVNPHLFDADIKDGLEINGASVSAQNVRLIATDVDMQFYGCNISKKPYEFFSILGVDWAGDSIIGVSFWSWFEKHMSDSIEYLR